MAAEQNADSCARRNGAAENAYGAHFQHFCARKIFRSNQTLHFSLNTCYQVIHRGRFLSRDGGEGVCRVASSRECKPRLAENKTRVGVPSENARREDANNVLSSIAAGEQGE